MKKTALLLLLTFPVVEAVGQDITGSSSDQEEDIVVSGTSDKHVTDQVSQKEINKGLVTNSLDALNGQVAGVNISNGADRMAMLSSVRVRGTTSLTGDNNPLVIIDGMYSDISTLNSIYPADIEKFSVLKNAAETALYGSRGASGVIVVTTKKYGARDFHISYDGNIGFESIYKNMEMLSGNGYRNTAQALGIDFNDGGQNTNFPEGITRNGFIQHHHIAFSNQGDNSSYRASVAMMDHNSVIKEHGNNNFAAKFDLKQFAINRDLEIDFGIFGSSTNADNIFDEQKLFYSAAAQNPTFPLGMSNGGWSKNSVASQINPPMALIQEQDRDKLLIFNTHLEATAHLGIFQINGLGSYSFNSNENAKYLPTWVWAQGQAYRAETKVEEWMGHLEALYFSNLIYHGRLDFTLGTEYQKRKQRGFFTTVKGFSRNDLGYDNMSAGSTLPYGGTGSSFIDPSLASFLGKIELMKGDFKMAANARLDGSSMFGSGNKWGFFPSISASYNLINITDGIALNTWEIRTSYGLSGNTGGIGSYNSLLLLNPTGLVSWNGTPTTTMGITQNANPDLKWETKSSFNIGMELGNAKTATVSIPWIFSVEYYYTRTRDMLYMYDVPVPPFTFDKLLANMGSMSNSGWEFGLSIQPITKKDIELNININLALQKNKLISLSGDYNGTHLSAPNITPIGSLNGAGFHGGDNNIVYQIIGQPLGVFYLPHCTGLATDENGRKTYIIEDLDHNGEVNIADGKDRYIAGQATPKSTLGSNISFRYKDFDIALQMNGAFGHKIYNGTSLTYMNMASFPDYNVMPKAPKENIYDQVATDYWLERGDYINLDYITLGWNVPVKKFSKIISKMRLSLSINNLFTITGYSGMTPMVNSYVVGNTLGIDDKRSYPVYRSFSFGFSIQL